MLRSVPLLTHSLLGNGALLTHLLLRNGPLLTHLSGTLAGQGGPTTECAGIGASNWPYRGSKCSIWEGGTHGTSFMWWAGLPQSVQGSVWPGLAHAADWLPTAVDAVGLAPLQPGKETLLPLDGVSLWPALLSGGASPRQDVYYGINQYEGGPAVRDTQGNKMILGGDGGGKGVWSPQELPNGTAPAALDSDAAAFKPAALNCSAVLPGVCLPGAQVGPELNTTSAGACCQACASAKGCVAWTLNLDAPVPGCFLHHALPEKPRRSPHCTSGSSLPVPTEPAPAFFDLVQDFAERVNFTEIPSDAVARLHAIVAKYEASKVPQKTGDPSCSKYSPQTSPQGKWVGPWCD